MTNTIRIEDPAMDMARQVADELGSFSNIPPTLIDPANVARYLDAIDDRVAQVAGYYESSEQNKKLFVDQISELSKVFITDVENSLDRVVLTLKLWAGCLDAAKTIAMETRNGPNTQEGRHVLFKDKIDPLAQVDEIYRAGVEAAPFFKTLRNQDFSFDGVPQNSPVRSKYEKI